MARILLDQNMPQKLQKLLPGHEVETADSRGWATLPDGHLLVAAERAGFTVLVTADSNIPYQQNISHRSLALVILSTNSWPIVRDNVALILGAINRARRGSCAEVMLPWPPRKPRKA